MTPLHSHSSKPLKKNLSHNAHPMEPDTLIPPKAPADMIAATQICTTAGHDCPVPGNAWQVSCPAHGILTVSRASKTRRNFTGRELW
jgi:hypothetical protein